MFILISVCYSVHIFVKDLAVSAGSDHCLQMDTPASSPAMFIRHLIGSLSVFMSLCSVCISLCVLLSFSPVHIAPIGWPLSFPINPSVVAHRPLGE